MKIALAALEDLAALDFDALIDVRSPSEFAEDHVPGAVNLPALSDSERAKVGLAYVRDSRFLARKMGAAMMARNAARHIETDLREKDGSWRPLVYCWRGGQRSGAFAMILEQIGWRATLLDGGYRNYRRLIARVLREDPLRFRPLVLDGGTGSAKTEILTRLAARGAQVVDLEAHANHRGSIFGSMGEQPGQKAFESRIVADLARFDPARPVVVEAESSKVGDLQVPPSLWEAMKTAPRLRIEAPASERAAYTARTYADLAADKERLLAAIGHLAAFHSAERVSSWRGLASAGRFVDLAEDLIVNHYDPGYRKAARRFGGSGGASLRIDDLGEDGLSAALPRIEAALDALDARRSVGGDSPASAPDR